MKKGLNSRWCVTDNEDIEKPVPIEELKIKKWYFDTYGEARAFIEKHNIKKWMITA